MSLAVLALAAAFAPLSAADVVIASDRIELLEAGSFDDETLWELSSTRAFSNDPSQYSVGIVADGELSFTHARPDNFASTTIWGATTPTDSNDSTGAPDGYYVWSRGPDITLEGYAFTGLSGSVIANVSMVLHIEIPDALTSDEIRITIAANGPERLVRTIARTFNGVYRMDNPMVVSMDGLQAWTWSDLGNSSVTVDYVSNGAPDDSEVRVDAVGIRVKYHQPWYSFETARASHSVSGLSMPVLDFGPYDGIHAGLSVENCGLTPDEGTQGTWDFNVEVPHDQELGRIHVFGEGNYTIEAMPQGHTSIENFQSYENGELLVERDVTNSVRITIYDGCIEMARVDVNDPHLVVEGWTSGSTAGLASFGSNILFAVGSELVNSTPITPGPFSISVPIGHALPSLNEALDIAVGARFQWSSNGAAETTVVHITSMSIVGGFHLEWDLSVTCSPLVNIEMDEDGGGLLIPMASRCEDDLTAWEDLQVFAFTEDSELIEVSALGGDIRIQPVTDASGDAAIIYGVVDASGNQWIDDVLVHISPVEDPPSISGLPVITYIELGQTRVIDVDISDPDTSNLLITTSRSWATIDDFGDLILTPVEPGVHMVEIIATDGTHTARQSIEVVVTAMPDLVLENLEVWLGGASVSVVNEGDVVQLKVYVRNEGRGVANGVDVRCWLDGVLVGSSMIDSISPGGLGIATCDTQFNSAGTALINAMVDGTGSIEEANEDNNEIGISIDVRSRNDGGGVGGIDRGPTILAAAIGIVVISFAALQMSPGRVSKPFRKMK
jgi:hypothetical protein